MPRRGIGAFSDIEPDDETVEGRAQRRITKIALGERDARASASKLGKQAFRIADRLMGLLGLAHGRCPGQPRRSAHWSGFIELVRRHISFAKKWRQSPDRFMRECELGAGPFDKLLRRSAPKV